MLLQKKAQRSYHCAMLFYVCPADISLQNYLAWDGASEVIWVTAYDGDHTAEIAVNV